MNRKYTNVWKLLYVLTSDIRVIMDKDIEKIGMENIGKKDVIKMIDYIKQSLKRLEEICYEKEEENRIG